MLDVDQGSETRMALAEELRPIWGMRQNLSVSLQSPDRHGADEEEDAAGVESSFNHHGQLLETDIITRYRRPFGSVVSR